MSSRRSESVTSTSSRSWKTFLIWAIRVRFGLLCDVDFAQRLSGISNTSSDETIVTQRVARLRGVLACCDVYWKQNVSSNILKRDPCSAYQIELAEEAIFGQRSAASFATGPVIPDPFISPLGFTITPALSRNQPNCQNKPSKYKNTPFFLLQAFLCLTTIAGMTRLSNTRGQRNTLLTKFGLSLLDGSNEHIANSWKIKWKQRVLPAAGSLFRRAPVPVTEITYKFLAPVLSAQFITAPAGRPRLILNLFPAAPPRPTH